MEADAAQTLQDQVRGAVSTSHAGADQSDPRNVKKIAGRFPLRSLGLYERDAKHPVLSQGKFEQFLVAQKLMPRSVVVEHNGEAVAPSEFSQRQLNSGDRLEIVKIVAGG
jgi:thiamine biosynthesis protein ThiS